MHSRKVFTRTTGTDFRRALGRRGWGVLIALGIFGWAVGGCSDDDSSTPEIDAEVDSGRPDAAAPVCGNGVIEGEEECDDGNVENGDGCDEFCVIEYECGNGIIEFDEECDGDAFTTNCVWEGYLGGQLQCTDTCTQDATACLTAHEDLVAWYRLDTVSTLVADNTGNGHGCIAHELQGGFPAPINESTLFEDLEGSYAECGTGDATAPLDGFAGFTAEAWIKLNSYAGIENDYRTIVSRNQTADPADMVYLLAVAGSPFAPQNYHPMFAVGTLSASDIAFGSEPLMTGNWYHIAGVYDDGELSLYVDGVLSGGVTLDATGPVPAYSEAQTYLGGVYTEGGGGPEQLFDGFVDDIKLWSVARSAEEVCLDSGGFYDESADPVCTHPEIE
jgi:cysteine-rich repeat protein